MSESIEPLIRHGYALGLVPGFVRQADFPGPAIVFVSAEPLEWQKRGHVRGLESWQQIANLAVQDWIPGTAGEVELLSPGMGWPVNRTHQNGKASWNS